MFEREIRCNDFSFSKKGNLFNNIKFSYASTKTEMPVLLDENLVQDLWGNQLYVHHHSKIALKQAIHNDSHFLSSLVSFFISATWELKIVKTFVSLRLSLP